MPKRRQATTEQIYSKIDQFASESTSFLRDYTLEGNIPVQPSPADLRPFYSYIDSIYKGKVDDLNLPYLRCMAMNYNKLGSIVPIHFDNL